MVFYLLGSEGSFVDVSDGRKPTGVVLAQLKPGANIPAYVMSVSSSMRVYLHTEAAIDGGHFTFRYWEGKYHIHIETGNRKSSMFAVTIGLVLNTHPWLHIITVSEFTCMHAWASCQIRKIVVCTCTENARNVFPATDFERKC